MPLLPLRLRCLQPLLLAMPMLLQGLLQRLPLRPLPTHSLLQLLMLLLLQALRCHC